MKKIIAIIALSVFFSFGQIAHAKEREYHIGTLVGVESSENLVHGGVHSWSDGQNTWTNSIDLKVKDFYIAIALNDLLYIGEYRAKWRWSDEPNFIIGDPIEVSIDGNKMFLKRNDGKKDFKTKIVKTIRNTTKQISSITP